MYQLAITKITCTSEFLNEELDNDVPGEKLEALRDALASLLAQHGFEYQYGETLFLQKQKYSICNCQKCGHYMVDRSHNPVGLDRNDDTQIIVFDGAVVDGVQLCEDCLPEGHRWSGA